MPTFMERIQKFQARLGDFADVAFIPLSADLEYLTGIPRDIPNFGVTIHPGHWLEGAWLTPNQAPILALPRMSAEFNGLNRVQGVEIRVLGDWDDPEVMVSNILKDFNLPVQARVAVSDIASAETLIHIQQIRPDARFVSATSILREQRTIKDEDEIALMREAGAITEAAFGDVLKQLKIGMTELDIVAEVDYQLRRHGSLGPSFTTSLYNSGPNHPLSHGDRLGTWKRVLTAPVSILFDFGGAHKGMCYDYGRTVSFGQPNEEFVKVHRLVMDAQKAGIAALKAGENTCEQADAAARQVIIDAGLGPNFKHRLGHGIGMDVHEPPFLTQGSDTVVQEGMMFTVEPSILISTGFSARVEDIIVVRQGGGEPLTRGFQDLIVIE